MKRTKNNACKYIIVLLVLSAIFLYGCNKENSNLQFSETVDEVINKIEDGKSQISYEEYLEVSLKEPEIIKNVSDGLEPGTNYVSENIIIKNINESPIRIRCKVYLPKEIINTIAYAPTTFEHGDMVELASQKELDIAAAIIMKKIDAMTDEEKKIFDKYSKVVYVEAIIDDKYCYFKKEL